MDLATLEWIRSVIVFTLSVTGGLFGLGAMISFVRMTKYKVAGYTRTTIMLLSIGCVLLFFVIILKNVDLSVFIAA